MCHAHFSIASTRLRSERFLLQPNSDLKDEASYLIGSKDEAAQSSFLVSIAAIEGMKEKVLACLLVKHFVRCYDLNFEMVAC